VLPENGSDKVSQGSFAFVLIDRTIKYFCAEYKRFAKQTSLSDRANYVLS
jgi:hypothetical protein